MKPNTTHRERNRSPLTLVGLAVGVVCALVVLVGFRKVAEAGSKIAFTSNRKPVGLPDRQWDIYVMTTNGSNWTRLTNSDRYDGQPAWSPDGSQIAYASEVDGNLGIYVMNANGSNQHRVSSNLSFIDFSGQPAWSPDGTRIVFASDRSSSDASEELPPR